MEYNSKGLKGISWGILIILTIIALMYAVKNFIPKATNIEFPSDIVENKTDSSLYAKIDSMYNGKITISKQSGIPAMLRWESAYVQDYKINKGSSLTREWIVLNDVECPVQLTNSVGVNTTYRSSDTRFTPTGNIETSVPITAYEVLHVLYNVFGEYLVTLSNVDVADINGSAVIDKDDSWYASNNQISEYSTCVSFVVTVRTKEGTIWSYNPLAITAELEKIKITYKEEYRPTNEPGGK